MTAATTPTDAQIEAVDAYLAALRSLLDDLTEDEIDDILTDVAAHLHEVTVTDERPLADVIGTPESFAAELRQTAGLAPRPDRDGDVIGDSGHVFGAAVIESLRAGWRRSTDNTVARAVAAFVPELRPAWWVLRGYLAVLVAGSLTADFTVGSPLPVPAIFGSYAVGLVALCGAVPLSVRWGRQAQQSGDRRVRLIVAGIVLAIAGLVVVNDVRNAEVVSASHDEITYPHPPYDVYGAGYAEFGGYNDAYGLFLGNTPVVNILPYDAAGNPLDGVRLFDQEGRPLTVSLDSVAAMTGEEMRIVGGIGTVATDNAFPLRLERFDPSTNTWMPYGLPRPITTSDDVSTTTAIPTTDVPTTDVPATTALPPAEPTTTAAPATTAPLASTTSPPIPPTTTPAEAEGG